MRSSWDVYTFALQLKKDMYIKRIIIVFAITLISQIADAQAIIKGLVVDADTNEPVIGATISNAKNGKPLTVTNADGRFQIPRNNEIKLKISYIGYKTLIPPRLRTAVT